MNGLIRQWVKSRAHETFVFPIAFAGASSYAFFPAINETGYSDKSRGFSYNVKTISETSIQIQVQMQNDAGGDRNANVFVAIYAIGY